MGIMQQMFLPPRTPSPAQACQAQSGTNPRHSTLPGGNRLSARHFRTSFAPVSRPGVFVSARFVEPCLSAIRVSTPE